MRSLRTVAFKRLLRALGRGVRYEALDAWKQFNQDPRPYGLRFKEVENRPGYYSARIGLGHRALCRREPGVWVWGWIGTHAEYDQILRQKRRDLF